MKKSQSKGAPSERIEAAVDWRGELLSRLRALISEADPEMTEERKWRKPSNPAGVPTWSHNGLVCTGETYKNVVKMTFARGASLADPSGLFNSSLEGNNDRGRHGPHLLRDPRRLQSMACREPRRGRLPVGGLLQEGI